MGGSRLCRLHRWPSYQGGILTSGAPNEAKITFSFGDRTEAENFFENVTEMLDFVPSAFEEYFKDEHHKLPDDVFSLPPEVVNVLVTLSGMTYCPTRIHRNDAKKATDFIIKVFMEHFGKK